jgi:hypothetical protein
MTNNIFLTTDNVETVSYFLRFYAPFTRFFNRLLIGRKETAFEQFKTVLIENLPTISHALQPLTLQTSDGKRSICYNMERLKNTDLYTAWDHLRFNGRLDLFLKCLGVPDDALTDADFLAMKTNVVNEFNRHGSGFQAMAQLTYRMNTAAQLQKMSGSTETNEEVKAILAKLPTIKRFFDRYHQNVFSTLIDPSTRLGKWVKTPIDPIHTGMTMDDMFSMMRNHGKQMKGCWNTRYGGNTSQDAKWSPACLVENMTCDSSLFDVKCVFDNTAFYKCNKATNCGCPFPKSCSINKSEIPPTDCPVTVSESFWLGAQDLMDVSFKEAVDNLVDDMKPAPITASANAAPSIYISLAVCAVVILAITIRLKYCH